MRLWVSSRLPFTPFRVGVSTRLGDRRRSRSEQPSAAGVIWLSGLVIVVVFLVSLSAAPPNPDGLGLGVSIAIAGLPSVFLGWFAWWLWRARRDARRPEVGKAEQRRSNTMPTVNVDECAGCVTAARVAARTGHRVDCLSCGRSLVNPG